MNAQEKYGKTYRPNECRIYIKLIKASVSYYVLRHISLLTLSSDALSLSNVCLPRYNNQQHAEKILQSLCTMNKFSLSLSLKTLMIELKN